MTKIEVMVMVYREAREAVDHAQRAYQASELALLEERGRGDSLRAQWVRAFIAGRHDECSRILKEPGYHDEPWPDMDDAEWAKIVPAPTAPVSALGLEVATIARQHAQLVRVGMGVVAEPADGAP